MLSHDGYHGHHNHRHYDHHCVFPRHDIYYHQDHDVNYPHDALEADHHDGDDRHILCHDVGYDGRHCSCYGYHNPFGDDHDHDHVHHHANGHHLALMEDVPLIHGECDVVHDMFHGHDLVHHHHSQDHDDHNVHLDVASHSRAFHNVNLHYYHDGAPLGDHHGDHCGGYHGDHHDICCCGHHSDTFFPLDHVDPHDHHAHHDHNTSNP